MSERVYCRCISCGHVTKRPPLLLSAVLASSRCQALQGTRAPVKELVALV
jgi:hypothetical protein